MPWRFPPSRLLRYFINKAIVRAKRHLPADDPAAEDVLLLSRQLEMIISPDQLASPRPFSTRSPLKRRVAASEPNFDLLYCRSGPVSFDINASAIDRLRSVSSSRSLHAAATIPTNVMSQPGHLFWAKRFCSLPAQPRLLVHKTGLTVASFPAASARVQPYA